MAANTGVIAAALLAAVLASSPAAAQDKEEPPETIATIPVIRADVVFRIPRGFLVKPGTVDRQPASYQAVFFPPGHDVNNWSERLRLLVVRGHVRNPGPASALLYALAERSGKECATEFFVNREPEKSSARAAALWGCKGDAAKKVNTLMGYYHVALGQDDSYILMRERRIPWSAASLLAEDEEVLKWKKDTDTLNVCPLGQAPCGALGEVPR